MIRKLRCDTRSSAEACFTSLFLRSITLPAQMDSRLHFKDIFLIFYLFITCPLLYHSTAASETDKTHFKKVVKQDNQKDEAMTSSDQQTVDKESHTFEEADMILEKKMGHLHENTADNTDMVDSEDVEVDGMTEANLNVQNIKKSAHNKNSEQEKSSPDQLSLHLKETEHMTVAASHSRVSQPVSVQRLEEVDSKEHEASQKILQATETLTDSVISNGVDSKEMQISIIETKTVLEPSSTILSGDKSANDVNETSQLMSSDEGVKNEDFPSYSEWTQKMLAKQEETKQDAEQTAPSSNVGNQKRKMRSNYASVECGAKIIAANAEAQNTKSILNSNKDDYMINPCSVKKWFIVELCEPIQIKSLDTASLELFSSPPKSFRILVSDRYPTKEWQTLTPFEASEERTIQSFQVTDDSFSKFVRVEMMEHFGNEHFCPLTLFRIFGFTMEEDMDETGEHIETNHESFDLGDELENGELSKNLFSSAKDTVMRLFKSVLPGTPEQIQADAAKENLESDVLRKIDTAIKPPNVTIPSKGNCSLNFTETKNVTGEQYPCTPNVSTQQPNIKSAEEEKGLKEIHPVIPEVQSKINPDTASAYAEDKLVTKLEDYEQIPSGPSEDSLSKPLVQLIDGEESSPTPPPFLSRCSICEKRQYKGKITSLALPWLCAYVHAMVTNRWKKHVCESKNKHEPLSSISKFESLTPLVTQTTTNATLATVLGQESSVQEKSKESGDVLESLSSHSEVTNKINSLSSREITLDTVSKSDREISTLPAALSVESLTFVVTSQSLSTVSVIPVSSLELKSQKLSTLTDTPTTTVVVEPSSTVIAMEELMHETDVLSNSEKLHTTLTTECQSLSSVTPPVDVTPKTTEKQVIGTAQEQSAISSTPADPSLIMGSSQQIKPTKVMTSSAPAALQSAQGNEEKVVKAVNTTDGRKHLVRIPLPAVVKRESAIMRLNNRIKALELNVSLSSRFLDELSQRYRKQSDEMMKILNRTVARLTNFTRKVEERDQSHDEHLLILESRLDNLTSVVTKLAENMDMLSQQLTKKQMMWISVELFVLTLIFVVCLKKQPAALSPEIIQLLDKQLKNTSTILTNRRSSDGDVLSHSLSSNKGLTKQLSYSAIVCPKTVSVVEPVSPFLLGQTREGSKKKKKKKQKILDCKSNSYEKEIAGPFQSTLTQLNSAGLLFGSKSAKALGRAPGQSSDITDKSSSGRSNHIEADLSLDQSVFKPDHRMIPDKTLSTALYPYRKKLKAMDAGPKSVTERPHTTFSQSNFHCDGFRKL